MLSLLIGCDGSGDTSSPAAARPDAGSMKISLEAAEQYLVGGDLVESISRLVDGVGQFLVRRPVSGA